MLRIRTKFGKEPVKVCLKKEYSMIESWALSQKRLLRNLFWGWLLLLFTLMPCKGELNKFAENVTLALSLQRRIRVLHKNWIVLKMTGAIEMR